MIYKVLYIYISQVVVWDFSHQQYDINFQAGRTFHRFKRRKVDSFHGGACWNHSGSISGSGFSSVSNLEELTNSSPTFWSNQIIFTNLDFPEIAGVPFPLPKATFFGGTSVV